MKLISSLVVIAAASNKKVPHKTPMQRLSTLTSFFSNYASEIIAPIAGAKYAARIEGRMHKMTANMGAAFNRPTCGYYDDSTRHGGPDPNPEQRENGKPRNRRSDDDDHVDDHVDSLVSDTLTEACVTAKFEGQTVIVRHECCTKLPSVKTEFAEECKDAAIHPDNRIVQVAAEADASKAKSGSGKRDSYSRLSNDPALKWKQIMTGCRKWAERFIGNCSGQRKNNLIKKRTKNVLTKVNAKLGF